MVEKTWDAIKGLEDPVKDFSTPPVLKKLAGSGSGGARGVGSGHTTKDLKGKGVPLVEEIHLVAYIPGFFNGVAAISIPG